MVGRALLWATAALVACACSDDVQNVDSPASLFCDGLCQAAPRCGGNTGSCESYCRSDRSLSELSEEGARRYGACLGSLDCGELGDEEAGQACWDDARVAIPPTAELRSFCTRYAEAWFECGSWFSVADCEDVFGMWADRLLGQALLCTEQGCLELETCVAAIFGEP